MTDELFILHGKTLSSFGTVLQVALLSTFVLIMVICGAGCLQLVVMQLS